jgi:hypothetical protein
MVTTEELTPNGGVATAPDAPAAAVEQKVEDAAPAELKETVESVEEGFNEVVGEAKADDPAEKAAADAADPEIVKTVSDVEHGNVTAVVGDLAAVKNEVKAGYKTTEFWLTLVSLGLTNLGAIHIPGKYGQAITDGAALAAYTLSRGLAKNGASAG